MSRASNFNGLSIVQYADVNSVSTFIPAIANAFLKFCATIGGEHDAGKQVPKFNSIVL